MKNLLTSLLIVGFAGTAPALAAPTAFHRLTGHYDAIRIALLHDRMDGVNEHAKAIEGLAAELSQGFEPGDAGVEPAGMGELRKLLPSIQLSAGRLAAARSLAAAREALHSLTKPLIRYRELASGERPVVVYCSMADKSWLQPRGEIGNPYYGQSMARCGEVVAH